MDSIGPRSAVALLTAASIATLLFARQRMGDGPSTRAFDASNYDDNPAVLKLGLKLREEWKRKTAVRLRELKALAISDVPRWSFGPEIYLWDWYVPYWPCTDCERIGRAGDGGKFVCGMTALEAKPPGSCIIYSYGVRGEASFEAELADRTACEIYAHDPSVDGLPPNAQGRPSIRFQQVGLSDADGIAGEKKFSFETLVTSMTRRGHTMLDLLKIDIERMELTVLPAMLKQFRGKGVPFKQLLLEIHHNERTPDLTHELFAALEAVDVVPFMNEINHVPCLNKELPKVFEYSFVALKTAPLAT